MTERLLQFIWQHRYFNSNELCTDTGEALHILSPGVLNTRQGPDFLQAAIRIGNTIWAGSIELHLLTSGWERHAHDEDPNYDNVILHVVWENDRDRADPQIPLLVLQHRVPKLLLTRYEDWMNNRRFVPCERQLPQIGEAVWPVWNQRLLMERWERKAALILDHLRQDRQDWEQTVWWLLARNFGIPSNTEAFGSIARSLPLTLVARHREEISQLEALLLGQAGLLEGVFKEEYARSLQRDFHHFRAKYHLRPTHEPVLSMRMRPANLPAVRLAQLAALLQRSGRWCALILDASSWREWMGLLDVSASPFWDTHCVVGKRSAFRPKHIGSQMQLNILINSFLPLLFAYGSWRKEEKWRARALDWLRELEAEENTILAGWARLGVNHRSAAQSQALLELKTRYCDAHRCLDCSIGKALLGKG